MKKYFLPLILTFSVILFSQVTKAQDYNSAVGVRIGPYTGLNYKTFLNTAAALDFNLSFRNHEGYKDAWLTGLYEVHTAIPDIEGLKWYYGGGASLGSQKYIGDSHLFFSVDGVAGLDYKFKDAPINLSIDWRPRLELSPDANVTAGDIGLGVRFTF